jgi:hypothetical protein
MFFDVTKISIPTTLEHNSDAENFFRFHTVYSLSSAAIHTQPFLCHLATLIVTDYRYYFV